MRKKRIVAITAAACAVGLAAAACGSNAGSTGSTAGVSGGGATGYNAALTSIVNQSSSVGSSPLKLESSTNFDSLDPGVTYEAVTWDLYRLFDRTMLTFKQEPGAAGLQVEGDLATNWSSSNNNKTWSFTIVDDAKFSNGDPITTTDIAYAIERSNFDATGAIHGGPAYFASLLDNTTNYQGPYKDPTGQVSGILTPDATHITFNLKQSFADFPYLMTLSQTSPIEPSHDAGTAYGTDISKDLFTGQYTVASYNPNSELDLVPNPNFVAASDPNHVHNRYASGVDISLNVNSTTVDQNLLQGSSNLDIHGLGVSSGTQSIVLANPKDKADADAALSGFGEYMSVNTTLSPFTNQDCREAVEWAVDKKQVQDVSGGAIAGGTIATTVLPTVNTGYQPVDQYATPGEAGDQAKATQLVDECKAALGSSFNPSFTLATYDKASHPKFVDAAEVVATNLNAIGFNVTVQQYNYSTAFFQSTAGLPSFATSHRIGLSLYAWGADFPTGYGYMDMILTKDGISSLGNSYNLSYWDDPTFDADMQAALSAPTAAQTNADYAKADQYAMSQAVIVPLLYMSDLLYRPPATTNVTVSQAYGLYDYSILGTK
jgi:peptide/nickel transport system substrate-binding protein